MRCQTVFASKEAEARDALARGERDRALAILMEAHGAAIYRYCCRMLGPRLAEDVHQLVFMHAYESLPTVRGQAPLRSWLYGIARHRCIDALRREKHRAASADALPEIVDPEPPVDQRLAARQVLERCLRKLDPKVRDLVILRYQQELSYGEMAAICKASPAALQMRLSRALPLLRKQLAAESRP